MNGSQSSRGVCSNFLMFWIADDLNFQNHIGFHRKFLHLTAVPEAFWASQSKIGQKRIKTQSEVFSGCQEAPKGSLYITWSHLSHFWSIPHIGSSGPARWQARDKLLSRDLSRPTKMVHTRRPVTNDDYPCCRQSEHTNWFNSKYCTTVPGWFEGKISRDKTLSRFVTHLSRDKNGSWVDLACQNVQIWLAVFNHMIWER